VGNCHEDVKLMLISDLYESWVTWYCSSKCQCKLLGCGGLWSFRCRCSRGICCLLCNYPTMKMVSVVSS